MDLVVVTMQARSAYDRLNAWLRGLSKIQYALVAWIFAFCLSVLVGLALAGNSLLNAVMSAAGGATGVAIISYLLGKPDG
jgi:chaperone required for assembly of F1-ATPase